MNCLINMRQLTPIKQPMLQINNSDVRNITKKFTMEKINNIPAEAQSMQEHSRGNSNAKQLKKTTVHKLDDTS